MQYLLIDTHRRPIGTLVSDKTFAVGDTFQNHNSEIYTVVGLNWFNQQPHTQSLTVIPQSAIKVAAK
ncbi:hypothetical protein HJG54_22165 [Leptolyngbya sp. NK1-12]|uniref:Uncharacterized protein n=1 Tax=Leptolyngbya sp. NK1-12 TaxID=2547451 RepID=A0AA97AJU4_9CYAN|nr:hypothetical protein [Leptolyngbya sp. NK1-12]WNZ25291.1 hypothetical protein HJG54_22165 [Leptolyngbya sp. NK1-12]